jgi:hypothetical protein
MCRDSSFIVSECGAHCSCRIEDLHYTDLICIVNQDIIKTTEMLYHWATKLHTQLNWGTLTGFKPVTFQLMSKVYINEISQIIPSPLIWIISDIVSITGHQNSEINKTANGTNPTKNHKLYLVSHNNVFILVKSIKLLLNYIISI